MNVAAPLLVLAILVGTAAVRRRCGVRPPLSLLAGRRTLGRSVVVLAAALVAVPAALAAHVAAGSPQLRLNAADNKRASAVLVRQTDLLSVYRPDPKGYARPVVGHCPGLYMPDRSRVVITGSAKATFTNGGDAIGSSASYFRSVSDLEAYWRATVRPAFAQCLAKLDAKNVAPGVHARVVSVGTRDMGHTGADAIAGYRYVVRYWDDTGAEEVVYRTVVFIRSGRGLAHLVFADLDRECGCVDALALRITGRLVTTR